VTCGTTETVKFGNRQGCNGCLKICKYEDKNGNGQRDDGEPWLSGWEFTIANDSGYSKTVTTGGSGGTCGGCDYCVTICGLAAGQYTVTETPKDGWRNTDPGDGSLTKTVTVECDKTASVNFGNQQECSGCLKICKYEDKNGNGQRDDGEPWLSGWEFTIANDSGYSKTVTTGDGGSTRCGTCDYCVTICDLAAGRYTITETPKDGWTNTDPTDGSGTKTVTVTCGTTETVKFGNRQGCNGCLKICKYEDKNGNGQRDDGEPWLSGWEFTIANDSGYSKTVTTGGSGGTCGGCDYCVTICGLAAGQYTVTETPKDGWRNTDPGDGSLTKTVTVECDKTASVNFGNQQECSGCLKICKYEDKNGNGQRDDGEPWLSGWEFTIANDSGYSKTVTTGDGGSTRCGTCDYCVTVCDLAPGEYTIIETLKDGWTCTTGNPRTVTVICDKTTRVDFGNRQECTGCVKIYKYEDKDGDGKKDSGESYLSGWDFIVTDSHGDSWSGTTSRYGYVTICDLPTGDYTVTETPKDGWKNTDPADGSGTKTVTVKCDKKTKVYFGNRQECTGCVKIYKYNDKDGDGKKDSDESYLSGWDFIVTDSHGDSWSGTTGRYGHVTICDLPTGDYTITETPKDGWTNTDPADGSLTKTATVTCETTEKVKFGNKQKR
jgi:hypothetical protein